MNWGKWIFLVIVLFMAGTLTMVYIAFSQDYPLVTENYYQEELAYDKKLEKMNNHIQNDQLINVNFENNILSLNTTEAKVNMSIHYYRPSDSKLDQFEEFELNKDKEKTIKLTGFKTGLYILKLTYMIDEKAYYTEKEIMVN